MIAWPAPLIDDLARRKAVLFIGSGVSANSTGSDGSTRPPTWEEFLRNCASSCTGDTAYIVSLIEARDFLTACELLRDRLGAQWSDLLADAFSRPQFRPADIHKHIFSLDARIVVTPNFDKVYDVYAQHETHGSTVVKHYYDDDTPLVLRKNYRAVIKVHGSIDEPSRTVFTRSDYAKLRHRHEAFQRLIDALFLTHTFLFLGCGLNDPDLRLFLEQHAQRHPSAPAHYITSTEGDVPIEMDGSLRSNMNLEVIRYSSANGHSELTESLSELSLAVEARRGELADRLDW